jgi:hypothetical protein
MINIRKHDIFARLARYNKCTCIFEWHIANWQEGLKDKVTLSIYIYIYIYTNVHVYTCTYNISGLYIDIFINLSLWTMQLTKKSTCPTKFFSCPKKINKNYKNQRIIISNLCKMFWLLSHKHHLILSLLILRDIMIMTTLIDKLAYTKSLVSLSNDVIMTSV